MNLGGPPTRWLQTHLKRHFHQTNHPRVVNLNPGQAGRADSDRPGEQREPRPIGRHSLKLVIDVPQEERWAQNGFCRVCCCWASRLPQSA